MESTQTAHIRKLSGFLVIMGLFWVVSAYLLVKLTYWGTFMELNQYRNPVLDVASLYLLTHLGDGLIFAGLLLLLFWRKNPSMALTGVLSALLAGLVTISLKTFVFPEWDRPGTVFQHMPCIPIYHPHPELKYAFPSGHATIFAAAGVYYSWFAYDIRKWLPWIVGLFTVLLCYTRVVLGVHFPGDIWVGSMIGVAGGLLGLVYLSPKLESLFGRLSEEAHRKLRIAVYILAPTGVLLQFFFILKHILA